MTLKTQDPAMKQRRSGRGPCFARWSAVLILLSAAVVSFAGEIVPWGDNYYGQLNNTPTGTGFVQVAAGGYHSIALKANGSIVDWGYNNIGQLNNTPTGTGFVQVAAGGYHSVALKADGSIVDWGNGWDGQLNNTPTGTGFDQVAAGGYHSVALKADGSIVDWGDNYYGQLNNTPTGTGFVQVAAGGYHSVALKADGSIVDWGDNFDGQLNNTPTGTGFVQVAAGGLHSVALKADGSIVDWGSNWDGQLNNTPTGTGFVQVAAGLYHSIALKANGSIVQWGDSGTNQLSGFPNTFQNAGFVQVAAGFLHSFALKAASGGWTTTYLSSPGSSYACAYGIGDGQVCGFVGSEAALWDLNGNFTSLHPTSGPVWTRAFSVAGGIQVGEANYDNGGLPEDWPWFGSMWSSSPGSYQLTPVGFAASSTDGTNIVGTMGGHAYLLNIASSTLTDLNPLHQWGSAGLGIGGGQIVGVTNGGSAALWEGPLHSWTDLGGVGSTGSHASATDGTQQVGAYDQHATVWKGTAASRVDLHPLGADTSFATGVTSGLQVGSVRAAGLYRAMLWMGTKESLVNLHSFLTPDIIADPFAVSLAHGIWTDGSKVYVVGQAGGGVSGAPAVLWTSTPAPDTTFVNNYDGFSTKLTSGGTSLSSNVFFAFDGSATTGVSEFQYSLDGAPYMNCGKSAYFGGLALGGHTFQVRAINSGGIPDLTPATFTWYVITPASSITQMKNLINSLGITPIAFRNMLLNPLNQALANLNDGNPNNNSAVKGLMTSFIAHVNTLLNLGKISPATAQYLIDQALAIKAAV